MAVQGISGRSVVAVEDVELPPSAGKFASEDLTIPPLPPGSTPFKAAGDSDVPTAVRLLNAFRTFTCVGATAVVLAACSGPRTGAPINEPAFHAERTIAGVAVGLAPSDASQAQKYLHYANIVAAADGNLRDGRPYVLALRGLNYETGAIRESRATSQMSDTIVVLNMTPEGQPVVTEFVGSTHPGQPTTTGIGQDVTGDGIKDVGMVTEGTYNVRPNVDFNGMPSYRVRTLGGSGSLPAVRDTNQDGIHSPEEWAFAQQRGLTASGILFHVGWQDQRVNSVGCFNVRGLQDFIDALGGPRAHYGVTIVNAYAEEPR